MNPSSDDCRFISKVPDGDNRLRSVCKECGWIHYENPKIIVGAVCTWEGKFLLCRRSIEPRSGFWTFPAGFLEVNETTEQGAKRESREEAGISIEIDSLLAVYSVARISQVYLVYRARMLSQEHEAGDESEEVRLFDWDEIPWADLAFPTVEWALKDHRRVEGMTSFPPHTAPTDSR